MVLLVLAMAPGCGSGSSSSGSAPGPGPSSGAPNGDPAGSFSATTRIYQHEVRLGLMQRTAQGWVPLAGGSPLPAAPAREEIRASHLDPGRSRLGQFVLGSALNPAPFGFYQLEGLAPPYRAYTPETATLQGQEAPAWPMRSVNSHASLMTFDFLQDPGGDPAVADLTFRITTPDASPKAIGSQNFLLLLATQVLELRIEGHYFNPPDGFPYYGIRQLYVVYSINGQELFRTVPQAAGAEIGLGMYLESPQSGNYTIATARNGQPVWQESYVQRALRFDPPLQPLEAAPGQNVTIATHLGWDDGDAAMGSRHPLWNVTIRNAEGSVVGVKSGNSADITAQWDPSELVLARGRGEAPARRLRLAPQGTSARSGADFTYTVNASADSYPDPLNLSLPEYYGHGARYAITEGPPAAGRGVNITEVRVEPSSFDPQAGENATLQAHVVMNGFEAPVLTWTAAVRHQEDPEDAPIIRLLEGAAAVNGTGSSTWFADIDHPWDGKDSRGQPLEEGDYRVDLRVQACEGSTMPPVARANLASLKEFCGARAGEEIRLQQGEWCLLAQSPGNFTTRSNPVLEVFDAVTSTKLATGSSADVVAKQGRSQEELKLLGRVYSGPQNVLIGSKVIIQARNLKFASTPPDHVTVVLKSKVSNKEITRTLIQQVPGKPSYKTQEPVTLDSDFILQDHLPAKTTYGSASAAARPAISNRPIAAFNAIMNTTVVPLYGSAKALGEVDYEKKVELANVLPPSFKRDDYRREESNFRAFGFEAVELSIKESKQPPQAQLKVKHRADVFFGQCHGSHGTAAMQLQTSKDEETVLSPLFLTREDISNPDGRLRTLMLNSCGVLDLHDYNNFYLGDPRSDLGSHNVTAGVEARFSPGEQWWSATGNGKTVLLGYNALGARVTGAVVSNYFTKLTQLNSSWDAKVLQQYSWMAANFDTAAIGDMYLHNACAWDDTYYYYIPFKRKSYREPVRIRPGSARGVYRILLSRRNEQLQDWTDKPPFAEQIFIR
jgi:hypothetical protein